MQPFPRLFYAVGGGPDEGALPRRVEGGRLPCEGRYGVAGGRQARGGAETEQYQPL